MWRGEGVESFCLRHVAFKILVRNANVDIKEAVEKTCLAFTEEVWAGETNSGVIHEHQAFESL